MSATAAGATRHRSWAPLVIPPAHQQQPLPLASAAAARYGGATAAGHQLAAAAGQRRQASRAQQRLQPPCSFMDSLDVPSLVPSWLRSSWLAPGEDDGSEEVDGIPCAAVRRQGRLRQLRQLLAAASAEPPLVLPPEPDDPLASAGVDEGSGSSSAGHFDVAHSASNAVPFYTGGGAVGQSGAAGLPCSIVPGSGVSAAAPCRAEEATQVLPWLYAVAGRLDFAAMEALASQLALSGLQLLDLSRYAAAGAATTTTVTAGAGGSAPHAAHSLPNNIRWAGGQAPPVPNAAVTAAAALRRMELRRGGALRALPETEGKVVVLVYQPQHRQLAAETVALYLHIYLGISGQEAVQAAGNAVGTSPLEATLWQSLEELATLADGWQRRVTLAWPYAGGHVEIVGDAVGGWEQRVPMVFDVDQKRWKLQIWGLPPGVHRFKYLVDGRWVIDLATHTEADSRGNINNVVLVAGNTPPPPRHGMLPASSSSSSSGSVDGKPLPAQQQAVLAASALATVAPQHQGHSTGQQHTDKKHEAEVQAEEQQQQHPWGNERELERMARFGAALLALHTRLGVQLRHVLH